MYIYSNTASALLFVKTQKPLGDYRILDKDGNAVACPLLRSLPEADGWTATLDAKNLTCWYPDSPVLYTLEAEGQSQRFGHMSLRSFQNKMVLLNDAPVFLRGYIRGIVAHDHPNMTGLSDYEAARKNILQAKKYGFNFVRFHSTVPSEEFMQAADELGLLVHMEIGFAYDYDENGKKKNLAMNNEMWEKTILRYRNHPSLAVCCIGNEMHNSGHYPQVKVLYDQGKALAPNKLILDNSGWGEYDRATADIFSQHIAYYFPYAHHKDMFVTDDPWKFNGSAFDVPLDAQADTQGAAVSAVREATPIRPTVSHEALHYIDIPDYEAMNEKFDAFAKRVGEDYLREKGIKKPRYLTEMPKLIARKGLTPDLPDYIRASRAWKLMATKVFLEKLRMSQLCGFEMLQFSDCLKYENKNGIVDFFDDDKGISDAWMRQFNSDLVLLADMEEPYCYAGAALHADIYASDFLPAPEVFGKLTVKLDGETVYCGEKFVLAGGLQRLVKLDIAMKTPGVRKLEAIFESEDITVRNDWTLWVYPRVLPEWKPELDIQDGALKSYLETASKESDLYLTDRLNEKLLQKLEEGKTAVLLYEHGAQRNTWQFQGALERFKPCIWDRGSNLGGIIRNKALTDALGGDLFDLNMQPLLEAGYKVNLDDFPVKATEYVLGADKPVRDRMKSLISNIKDFIDQDTLRRFSHLFGIRVGKGQLIVCTFNLSQPKNPVTANFLKVLLEDAGIREAASGISLDAFRSYLERINAEGIRKEDVMNHFWEIDNKPVEDTLFWEEAQVNLAQMRSTD